MLYLATYILIYNLHIANKICNVMKDAYITSLFVLFLADVSVMGYIYRAYFGRSLVNEHPV